MEGSWVPSLTATDCAFCALVTSGAEGPRAAHGRAGVHGAGAEPEGAGGQAGTFGAERGECGQTGLRGSARGTGGEGDAQSSNAAAQGPPEVGCAQRAPGAATRVGVGREGQSGAVGTGGACGVQAACSSCLARSRAEGAGARLRLRAAQGLRGGGGTLLRGGSGGGDVAAREHSWAAGAGPWLWLRAAPGPGGGGTLLRGGSGGGDVAAREHLPKGARTEQQRRVTVTGMCALIWGVSPFRKWRFERF